MADSIRDSKIDSISTRNNDMRGRRIINAAPSIDSTDYVIRKELDSSILSAISNIEIPKVPPTTQAYLQTNIPNARTTPVGTMIWVSDFAHLLINVGGDWVRILPNRFLEGFITAPSGNGWQLCNGASGIKSLNIDGTLSANFTVPTQPFYGKYGSAYSGPNTTLSVDPVFTGTSGTTGTSSANITGPSAATSVQVTTPTVNVASATHNHVDTGHSHTITPAGTIDVSGGDPVDHIVLIGYIRL